MNLHREEEGKTRKYHPIPGIKRCPTGYRRSEVHMGGQQVLTSLGLHGASISSGSHADRGSLHCPLLSPPACSPMPFHFRSQWLLMFLLIFSPASFLYRCLTFCSSICFCFSNAYPNKDWKRIRREAGCLPGSNAFLSFRAPSYFVVFVFSRLYAQHGGQTHNP